MVRRGLAPAALPVTACGRLVEEELTALMVRYPSVWVKKYVIMPNHIHALIYLQEDTAVEWLDNLGQSFGNPDTMTTSSGTTTFFEPLDLHRPKLRQMDRRRVLPGRTGEMAMKDQKKRTILSVVGMVALLIVCVVGVQAVFAGLGMVSAQQGDVSSSSQSAQADGDGSQMVQNPGASSAPEDTGSDQPSPSFCPFCGEGLPSAFQWGQFCPYCGKLVEA